MNQTNSNQRKNQWQQSMEERKKKIMTPIILFLTSIFLVALSMHHPARFMFFFFTGVGSLIWLLVTVLNNQSSHVITILDSLFKETNINLIYYNRPKNEFLKKIDKTYFFSPKVSKNYHSVFLGNIDGFPFVVGDIEVTLQTRVLNKIFRGPIGYVQIKNKLPLIIILPEKAQNSPDGIVKLLDNAAYQRDNFQRIHFDDTPDFEEKYMIWTTDEKAAKKLISPNLRNYLVQKTTVYPIYLTILDEFIYFAVNFSRYCFTINMTIKFTKNTFDTMKSDLIFYYNTFRDIIRNINSD